MLHVVALIDVDTHSTVSFESGRTLTLVLTTSIDTETANSSAVVLTGLTLVIVLARDAIALETVATSTSIASDRILTLCQGRAPIVFFLQALVLVITSVPVAPEALLALALERGGTLSDAVCV